jgi:hypothetical protein
MTTTIQAEHCGDVISFLRNQGTKLLALTDTIEKELTGNTPNNPSEISTESLKQTMGQRAWRKNQIAEAIGIQDPNLLNALLDNSGEFERNKRGWYVIKDSSAVAATVAA